MNYKFKQERKSAGSRFITYGSYVNATDYPAAPFIKSQLVANCIGKKVYQALNNLIWARQLVLPVQYAAPFVRVSKPSVEEKD